MADIIDDYYIIDKTLQGNPSVENLIKLMQVSYNIRTGDRRFSGSPTPQEPQQVYVGPVNDVWLGFWPTKGPVEQIPYSFELNVLIEDRTLKLVNPYNRDGDRTPRVHLKLTENKRRLKVLGLEHLLPGHAISLYLEPKK